MTGINGQASNTKSKRVDMRRNRPTRSMTAEQRERKRQSDRNRKRVVRTQGKPKSKAPKLAVTPRTLWQPAA